MKFNKLFFAAMAFAALAMVGCKDKKESETTPPAPNPGPDTEEVPETPNINAPAAGKTTIAFYAEVCPKGAYLVGNMNDYNIGDDALSFEAVANAKNWYQLTIDYREDMEAKVIARPSDPDVALAWDYQWGKNYDPDDANCQLKEGEANTVKLKGDGEWKFENGGEVKLISVKDGGVVYIWVKNWNKSPIIEAKKLETAWIKSDFFDDEAGDYKWGWHEMKKVGDGVFEFEGVWGGSGCNINEVGEDAGASWYPSPELVGSPVKGDKVKATFASEKMAIGSLKLELLEKGTPEPQGDPVTVTVKAKMPADWTNTPTAWVWPTGGDGVAATLTKEGDWWVYTTPEPVPALNIIWRNGDDWSNGQTQNLEGVRENGCYQIGTAEEADKDGKRSVTSVDCK